VESSPFLPPGFRAVKDEVVRDAAGREFYREIATDRGGADVAFVLIEQQTADDQPSYYLMKYKASNTLFARFIAANPGDVRSKGLWKGGEDSLPALGMTVEEAHRCAAWLGGLLPTTGQLDKAAGFFQRGDRAGPARGPRVAVGLRGRGPRPVDDPDSDDVSPLGIHDLAGNGTEFTRNLANGDTVPAAAPADAVVILRGHRHTSGRPLSYADLQYQQTMFESQGYRKGSPFTGFRVVLEPPAR
jgi:formylglycine-generating enzyme required for sulfatase activity